MGVAYFPCMDTLRDTQTLAQAPVCVPLVGVQSDTAHPVNPDGAIAMTRQPVKSLNKSAAEIKNDAQIERDRKKASKLALKTQMAADKAAAKQESAPVSEPSLPAKTEPTAEQIEAKTQADHEALVTALTIDAKAILGDDAPQSAIDAYVAEQTEVSTDKQRYTGPMLILRQAAKSYVKADNGILCNGDPLAMACGKHDRATVVKGLTALMNQVFPGFGTPYSHLNPGQQSMNLRNKTRHALKAGLVQPAAVIAALDAAKPAVVVAEVAKAE